MTSASPVRSVAPTRSSATPGCDRKHGRRVVPAEPVSTTGRPLPRSAEIHLTPPCCVGVRAGAVAPGWTTTAPVGRATGGDPVRRTLIRGRTAPGCRAPRSPPGLRSTSWQSGGLPQPDVEEGPGVGVAARATTRGTPANRRSSAVGRGLCRPEVNTTARSNRRSARVSTRRAPRSGRPVAGSATIQGHAWTTTSDTASIRAAAATPGGTAQERDLALVGQGAQRGLGQEHVTDRVAPDREHLLRHRAVTPRSGR